MKTLLYEQTKNKYFYYAHIFPSINNKQKKTNFLKEAQKNTSEFPPFIQQEIDPKRNQKIRAKNGYSTHTLTPTRKKSKNRKLQIYIFLNYFLSANSTNKQKNRKIILY